MDFQPKTYLIIYALIVTPILLSFLFMRRGPAQPTKLHFDQKPEAPPPPPRNVATPSVTGTQTPYSPRAPMPPPRPAPPPHSSSPPPSPAREEKSLNVFFNWNGHAWDAYEALGLPAGSSRDAVSQAFQSQLKDADADSVLFFKAAYEAILRSGSTRS